MLTKAQEQLIRSLHTKKFRVKYGKCLVEGEKFIAMAEKAGLVDLLFTKEDTPRFDQLVTTETPQEKAAIANLPSFSMKEILAKPVVLVLDGVQEPGNVGTILRLALGFNASVILIESADPSNSKAIRSSAGAFFLTPWKTVSRAEAPAFLAELDRPVYRLEKRPQAISIKEIPAHEPLALVVGSEGSGIQLPVKSPSVFIPHSTSLESLSVSHAVAIFLYAAQG